ncbi:MAG: polysaccharide lyase family protein [Verrucomicrobiota bacterium]
MHCRILVCLGIVCLSFMALTVRANDPGGGTNGANVTLTDNGSSVTLANGILSATIDKASGKVTSMLYGGRQVVQSGGNVYYSMDGDDGYREMGNCAYVIKTNSSDMVDVSFRQTWNTSLPYAFDIEAHWVLRRGNSGLYAYVMLDHPATYPSTTNVEWRCVWRFPNDVLERVYVDELRHWQMPSAADVAAAQATTIPEIVYLTTGVRAGRYDGKYQYAAEYENIGTWGHASSVNKIGAWMVTGNYEYFNDGPTKQDLTLAWDYNLIHFGRNHYTLNDSSTTYALTNVAWQKIYGPFLLYLNTNSAGGDALWADAKAQVQAEHSAWPYSWLTGNSNYPLANARGAVSGNFLVNDALKSSVSTSNAWVGLTDPSVNWQFDMTHYQYWVRAAADGSFSIQNVRPGTYTLHAFTDGEMNEYSLASITVTAGTTNSLGNLTWNIPRTGGFLLWEVGVPNRTATDYRHGTNDYYEGFIWNTFGGEFSNPLEYNIGASDWSKDLNYVHNSYVVNGVRNQWKWRLNFLLSSVPASGNATLNFAFASSQGASLNVYVNNEASAFTTITPAAPPAGGNALIRQGIHAKYFTQSVSIPVSNLRAGTNTVSLIMTSTGNDANHFMYDAINLELPSKPPLPLVYDLSWNGGQSANLWDLTAANWSSNATIRAFANGNRVLFDDTGLNSPAVRLTNSVSPASVNFYAMKGFTFTGSGGLAGTMALAKSGPGTLTLNNTNTFTGATFVTNGSLIVNGSLNSSPVTIRSGALAGGTGRFGGGLTVLAGGYVQPGISAPGTLIVSNAFVQTGSATNIFDLSDDRTGTVKTNDLLKVFGNVNVSGTNTLLINALDGLLADGLYPLIQCSGTFNAGLTNFVVRGVIGKPFALTNVSGTLSLLVISNRPPASVVWQGGLAANLWDQAGTSNWLNGASLDVFAFGDTVQFNNAGSTSPAVNLSGELTAASVTVNASVNYTFSGSGSIAGNGGLTKLGSGTLTVLTTNEFTGPTTINGGILAVRLLDDGGLPSGIGASTSDSSNLVIQTGATLRYLGTSGTSDHGATLGAGGGFIEVTNALANLQLGGSLTGVGSLTKLGPGMLSLGGSNNYVGTTLISSGSLQVGVGANSGTLGGGAVTNQGLLIFNRADALTVDNAIQGSGIVVKLGGGTTTLTASNSYSGGTTNAAGKLLLANNSALGTGPLTFNTTSGSVQVGDGVTVTNPWNIAAGITTDVQMDCPNGTGTWAGPVSIGSGASFRPGTSTGTGTLVYIGNASMGGANFIVPRGNVVIAANGVVTAGGTVCALGRSGTGTGTTFAAKDNASLTFASGFMLGHTSSGTAHPIVCTLQDNATLSTTTANFNLHNGPATGSTNTILNLNGGTLLTAGFSKTQVGAALKSTINFNGGKLKATTGNAAFLSALTGLTANIKAGGLIIDDGGFAANAIACPLIHDPALGAQPDGGLTKLGAGTLTLAANDTYTGPTLILAGTLTLYAPPIGSISNSSAIYIAGGALLDLSLGGNASLRLGNGQSISGNGSVRGTFTLGSGSTMSPGSNAIGTLTFSNSVTFAANSTNLFEIRKSPLTNDVAKISGALTNGGTLIVTNLGAVALADGDRFKLFDATSYSGAFADVKLPTLANGLAWDTSLLGSAGTISVIAITQPVIGSIAVADGQLILSGSGPTNLTYAVLTSTNLGLPLALWTPLATNQFGSSGGFVLTNTVNANAARAFYLLQILTP